MCSTLCPASLRMLSSLEVCVCGRGKRKLPRSHCTGDNPGNRARVPSPLSTLPLQPNGLFLAANIFSFRIHVGQFSLDHRPGSLNEICEYSL